MHHINRKKVHSFIFVCLAVLGSYGSLAQRGSCNTIVERAKKDLNALEGGVSKNNNRGALFSYYRSNVSETLNAYGASYCGCAVYSWFLEAGIKPAVKNPALARSWIKKDAIKLGRNTTPKEIEKLKAGMSVNMEFVSTYKGKRHVSNHVAVIEKPELTYIVTIEGNTSDPTDPRRKNKREGVFRKIRPYHILTFASDWCNTAAKTDSTQYLNLKRVRLKT